MKNQELANIFNQMADLMEILEEDRFRVNSYRRVGWVMEELAEPIEDIAAAGKLEEIEGVGKSTAEKIRQYLATGKIAAHQELLGKVPLSVAAMLTVPGLGPKTVMKLWRQGKVTSIEQLKEALASPGKLEGVEGIGPKKAQQILDSLAFLESAGGRVLLGEAMAMAEALAGEVEKVKGARRVVVAGSLRRGRETIGDLDLLCQASRSAAGKVMDAFTSAEIVQRVLAKGPTKSSVVLEGGTQADLRVVGGNFGAAWMYFTGSKAHNVRLRELAIKKGYKLNEYGLFKGDKLIAGESEEEVYKILGLEYIEPELREDRGEIAAAAEGKLPKLVKLSDIRGDLHMHTTASDGANTIEEMIAACRSRGYKYMAICDHSRSQIQARGLDGKRLATHVAEIRATAKKYKDIVVLVGTEVDIHKDGSLDYPDKVLAKLDFVTASPHSALAQGSADATPRIIKAIENPHVHCIGHPSGRLINVRKGMEIDIAAIAKAAAKHNVAMEVNADYRRLDLRDTHVRSAIEAGAKLVISTDAHSTATLDMMRCGISTARRGWATAADVINTWPKEKLLKWLKKK